MEGDSLSDALIPSEQIDDFVILRARRFTSSVRRELTRDILQAENLPLLEWQLLFSIARFGDCHVAFVTRRTSIDPAHGSRAAAALEKKGLISRNEDLENKRRKLMSLTPKGIATFERLWPRVRQVTANMTDRLSSKDFKDLKRLLDLLNGVQPPSATQMPEHIEKRGKETDAA